MSDVCDSKNCLMFSDNSFRSYLSVSNIADVSVCHILLRYWHHLRGPEEWGLPCSAVATLMTPWTGYLQQWNDGLLKLSMDSWHSIENHITQCSCTFPLSNQFLLNRCSLTSVYYSEKAGINHSKSRFMTSIENKMSYLLKLASTQKMFWSLLVAIFGRLAKPILGWLHVILDWSLLEIKTSIIHTI